MKLYKDLERFYLSKFYLLVPAAIIILACVGSIAVYFITKKGMSFLNFIQMLFCVVASMAYLTTVLGQSPRDTTFRVFFFALILQIVLLTYNLFF